MARQLDLDERLNALVASEVAPLDFGKLYLKVARDLNAKISRATFVLSGTGGDSWARCERALAILEGRI